MNKISAYKKRLQMAICLSMVPMLLTGCVKVSPMGLMMQWTVSQHNPAEQAYGGVESGTVQGITEPESTVPESIMPEITVAEGEYAQTIMVYMVGSDLESDYGNATLDLEEMMGADVDVKHNNIVVYTGGASEWQIEGLSAEKNAVLLLKDDGNFHLIDETAPNNMGEADTLSYFINYCYENFEAEKYGLILWNHGGGPVLGFGVDENYKDILNMKEMKEAFHDSVGLQEKKLEWVGFDACLMNSMEVADLLEPYANYMIASQETEPGWGWDYSFLGELSDKVVSGSAMGEHIVDYYMSYGETVFAEHPRRYTDLTLSCIDLQQYPLVEEALNLYFAEVDAGLSQKTYPQMVRNRENTRDFGSYSSSFDYGMVDAVHLLQQLAPDYQSAGVAIEAIENMVVYSRTNMKNANGISICYPYETDDSYTDICIGIQETIGFITEYTNFLRDFKAIENGETIARNWDITKADTSVSTIATEGDQKADTSDITLQLTPEQAENYAGGTYYIICNSLGAGYAREEDERAEDLYTMIHASANVELDENGVLHAYHGNSSIYLHDLTEDTYSQTPLILIEQDSTEEEKRYFTHVILHNWNTENPVDWKSTGARLRIVVNEEYPDGIIRQAVPVETDENGVTAPSKQLLDLEEYSGLQMIGQCYYYTQDENGNELPFYDWEPSGLYVGFEQDMTHEYCLETRPLENPENYYCVFMIKDTQGNMTYSKLIPLK